MSRTHKTHKRRRRRTMKMKGGNFDDPDTKDFMNSKIADLEHKISEMESNIPVYLGYSILSGLIFAPKDCDINFINQFILYPIRRLSGISGSNYNSSMTFISLSKLASLPNVKIGLGKDNWGNILVNNLQFTPLEEDDRDVSGKILIEKYPQLFYSD